MQNFKTDVVNEMSISVERESGRLCKVGTNNFWKHREGHLNVGQAYKRNHR